MLSNRRYKICICSVILGGKLQLLWNDKGFSIIITPGGGGGGVNKGIPVRILPGVVAFSQTFFFAVVPKEYFSLNEIRLLL